MKSILIFGERMREYPRNVAVLDAFARERETIECEVDPTHRVWSMLSLWNTHKDSIDTILVIQPLKYFIPGLILLRWVFRKQLILDMFAPIYETYVIDRNLAHRYSLKALYYMFLDQLTVWMADIVLCDTEAHREYVVKEYGANPQKVRVLPVSVDMERLRKVSPTALPHREAGVRQVVFAGYFIPLQGIEHIVNAAQELRKNSSIHITLIGRGQMRTAIEKQIEDLDLKHHATLMDGVDYDTYLSYLKGADVVLGVFGGGEKTARIIPNKLIEACALGVPVVTLRTPSVSEYFKDSESIFFCDKAEGKSLSHTIVRALESANKYQVGEGGRNIVAQHFSTSHLREIIKDL